MSDSPDLAGFTAAQRRLRSKLGRSVTFFTPLAPIFPSAVASGQFDPETHLPYDPVIQPAGFQVPASGGAASGFVPSGSQASGYASASATCSVVYQPLSTTEIRRPPSDAGAFGERDRSNKHLIADPNDLAAFKNATWFLLDGEAWRIELVKPDGIGGLQRYVIYGEELL